MKSFLKVFSKLNKIVRQNVIRLFKLTQFRDLQSKSRYFSGFSKNISGEHTYHFYIKN